MLPIVTLCYTKDFGKFSCTVTTNKQNFAGTTSKHNACMAIQSHLPEAVQILSPDDHILF